MSNNIAADYLRHKATRDRIIKETARAFAPKPKRILDDVLFVESSTVTFGLDAQLARALSLSLDAEIMRAIEEE